MARILVADDEPAIAMAIRDELLFEGFDVQLAQDGHGALALARTWQPGQRFPIRRLGWNEVIHAVLFAALLVLAFRTAG